MAKALYTAQATVTGGRIHGHGSTSGGDPLSLLNLDATIDLVDNPTHLFMSKASR